MTTDWVPPFLVRAAGSHPTGHRISSGAWGVDADAQGAATAFARPLGPARTLNSPALVSVQLLRLG